jgi:hypothetical protein
MTAPVSLVQILDFFHNKLRSNTLFPAKKFQMGQKKIVFAFRVITQFDLH